MVNEVTMDDCMFEMDGNAICCHLPDFINLMESPAGFGETNEEAFKDFVDNWEIGI